MMMIKAQKNVNPLVLRFGVALALSFAGFLYSRIRTKRLRTRPSLPPPPSSSPRSRPSSDSHQYIDGSVKIDETHASPRDSNCRDGNCSSPEKPYLRIRVDKSSSTSPSHHSGGDRDSLLLPEFNNLVTDFNTTTTTCDLTVSILKRDDGKRPSTSNDSPKVLENYEREGYLREIQTLRTRVRSLKEKERYLELQLLKYHALKEQVSAVSELQSRLKIHNVESKLLALRIDSLQGENDRLKAQAGEYSKVVGELDDANMKITTLRRKLRSKAEDNREQILKLKQKVVDMQLQEQQQQGVDHELKLIDPDVELKLRKVEDLENEVEELKKCNFELQSENSELARKLENAEIYASSVLNNPKIEELKSEAERLKEENIDLSSEVERLHSVRCADVEELVYLRWLNACLRHELRDYEPPEGKIVARDLSRSLSPTSEREAKRLILEYANMEEQSAYTDLDYDNWLSSHSSHHTDSVEADEVSVDHQSSLKPQKPKKRNLFSKFKKLVRGKHSQSNFDTRSSTGESTLTEECDNNRYSKDLPNHSLPAERTDPPSISRRSSMEVMPGSESFVIEDRRDLSRLWTTTPSRTSSSLDLTQPMTSLSEVDASSPVFSSYIHKRRDSGGKESAVTSPLGSQTDGLSDLRSRKSDLAKYAEVLKDTSPLATQKGHRKAVSLA